MANRGLLAADITELGEDSVEFYHLVRIDLSVSAYYTNAPYSIDYDDGDGVQTYTPNVMINFPKVTESLKIKPNTINLSLDGATQSVIALLLTESINAGVFITRYLTGTGNGFLVFEGFTDGFSMSEDARKGNGTISLKAANHWTNWETKSGRYFSDSHQQVLFSGDLGLEYAKVTDALLPYWGRPTVWATHGNIGTFTYSQVLNTGDALTSLALFYQGRMLSGVILQDLEEEIQAKKLPIIYGDYKLKGTPVFRTTTGAGNAYMWVVYALSEGECDSLIDIIFEDGLSYTDAKYSGYVTASFHSGTDSQTVDTALDAASVLWTSAHRLRGICYVVMRYTYKSNVWSGDPQPSFIIKGKKVVDPRVGGLATFSNNPAVILYDYLSNTVYGKGIPTANLLDFNDGATYSETLNIDHDGGDGGTPVSIELFSFNGSIDLDKSIKQNVESILFTMRAHLPWVSGGYTLVIEKHNNTSVYSFDDSKIKGSFNLKRNGSSSISNAVFYSVKDAEVDYQLTEVVANSAAYLALDGRELRKTYNNPYESNRYRAKARAETQLKKSRQVINVDFISSNADAIQIKAGDVVDITRDSFGWSSKLFRVTEMLIDEDGEIKFNANEYEPTVYDWSVSVETSPPADTQLINPTDVVAPTGLILTSGTTELLLNADGTIVSRIKAVWTHSIDEFVEKYNIYYSTLSDTTKRFFGQTKKEAVDGNEIYISPVEDGEIYAVYVEAVNNIGFVSSQISGSTTVIGKTATPENVTGFFAGQNGDVVVFKWNQVADLDLAGYEIRYGKNGSSSWDDATPLTSITRGTSVTSADVPPSTWDFYIKAVDTTGNYSSIATSVTGVLVESSRDVIVQNDESPEWSGIKTNFVLHHTGKLVPQSQEANSNDGATIWADDTVFEIFVNNPYQICTYEAAEIDIGFDDIARVWGSIESVLGVGESGIANPKLSIDYKLDAGSYDGFEDWSVGSAELRYCKHKLTLDTDAGLAVITGFNPTVDQLEHTQTDEGVAVAITTGTTITFDNEFHVAPLVSATVIGTTALFAVISAITATTFHVKIFNISGAVVAGTINWEATGI